jgi:hypothetical protein
MTTVVETTDKLSVVGSRWFERVQSVRAVCEVDKMRFLDLDEMKLEGRLSTLLRKGEAK